MGAEQFVAGFCSFALADIVGVDGNFSARMLEFIAKVILKASVLERYGITIGMRKV